MVPVFLQRLITGRLHPHQRTKGWPCLNVKGPTITGKKYFLPIFFSLFYGLCTLESELILHERTTIVGFATLAEAGKAKALPRKHWLPTPRLHTVDSKSAQQKNEKTTKSQRKKLMWGRLTNCKPAVNATSTETLQAKLFNQPWLRFHRFLRRAKLLVGCQLTEGGTTKKIAM